MKTGHHRVHPETNEGVNMTSFWQQLKALLWRNILLKKRNKAQVFQELFFPVYFVCILAMIRALTKPETKPALKFESYALNNSAFGQPFTASSKIYASPDTTQVNEWMQNITSQLNGPPQFRLFAAESEVEDEFQRDDTNVAAGIIFNYDNDPYAYAIRTDSDKVPGTDNPFNTDGGQCRKDEKGTDDYRSCFPNGYIKSGFAQLQMAIENTLLNHAGVSGSYSRNASVQLMDLETFEPSTSYIQTMSSIYFVFSFMILASYLAGNVVAEKEKKIREGMMMMGLRNGPFWFSWAIVYFAMVLFATAFMVAIIAATEFLKQSNMLLLAIIFILYGTSFISLAFMLTPFFSKASSAGAMTGFATLFVSSIYLAVSQTRDEGSYDSNVPAWSQWLMCLLSPIAFSTCIDQTIFLDIRINGIGFDDSLTYGKFPLYAPILMLAVDTVLYIILLLYFDRVIPGEYGVVYPPHFFLMRSFWFPNEENSERKKLFRQQSQNNHPMDIEMVPQSLDGKIAMKIISLTKAFQVKDKTVKAVNKFSLDIYEGHITCLLGHNGAGKTTLMNMLTGVVPPTSGNATVMGLSITDPDEMKRIRQMCGICPQHNILYDKLSCREHLKMFAEIKGVNPKDVDEMIVQALEDVGLTNQTETFAKDLSGGQKRKLSVAIALIGDPKLIFLDEPTAGMDPYSRRHLWSLLKKKKEGRVILLTTHFMDEADILSDRKAFIKKGKLRCCGSSLFLKNKFGIGYHLTLVVDPTCRREEVTSMLISIIPDILMDRSHGKELAYTIPLSEVPRFAELFKKIDSVASSMGIKSYGVSMTTLEEVFLKLEGQEEDDNDAGDNEGFTADQEDVNLEIEPSESKQFYYDVTDDKELWKLRFRAMFWIRFLTIMRNKRSLVGQIFLPVIFVTVALVIMKTADQPSTSIPEPLVLQPSLYVNFSFNSWTPPLLVFNSVGTASQNIINTWRSTMGVDVYPTGTRNTSDVQPHYMGLQLNSLDGQLLADFVALYNASASHAIPIAITMASQSMLNSSNIDVTLNCTTYPWPNIGVNQYYDASLMLAGMFVGLALLSIIPGFASAIVRDRETKLRSQLRIAGLSFNLYWGSMYVMNFLVYIIPCSLIIIMVLVLGIPGLDSGGAIAALLVLFLASIPFNCFLAFVTSFLFNKSESSYNYLPYIFNICALIPYAIVSIVDMVDTGNIGVILHYVFCIIDPVYLVPGGFYFIQRVNYKARIAGREVTDSDYFDPDNHTLFAMIMPLVHMVWLYWLLRVLDVVSTGGKAAEAFPCTAKVFDNFYDQNTDFPENEDSDVKAERDKVDSLPSQTQKAPVAYTQSLRKEFVKRVKKKTCGKPGKEKKKVAVHNLSFTVDKGEVFGLLGPNGAGKSTALNLMIAETEPTAGKVFVAGNNVRTNILSLSNSLGYCPQHDALWDHITLEEHIKCFASVKGCSPQTLESLVNYFVMNLKLQDHRKKRAKKLSGGTKRKLSYILSILGNPDLVLMDEPSTGMDPQSKRFLWDTISSSFRNTEKGAILTTHYMEEADALCGRIGIMVNGRLECIGSGQHLKNKYGTGYILEVKLAEIQDANVEQLMDKLESHLMATFPGMKQVERFQERAQYSIPQEDVKELGITFAQLETCKLSHNLEEYSFSQSTLEQVFLYFAKKQIQEEEFEEDEMEMAGKANGSMENHNRSHSVVI